MTLLLLQQILLSMVPIVAAGAANMAFVKASILQTLKTPIDRGRLCSDGKPLFGPNKTWKGALGMIVFCALAMLAFRGLLGERFPELTVYREGSHVYLSPFLDGALLGLAYILFELPNSYIKRRLDIDAGTNAAGIRGAAFTLIDQADSVLGCALLMLLITDISVAIAALIVAIGSGIHLIVNGLLYLGGLKKQAR